jgi:hypothetical protein
MADHISILQQIAKNTRQTVEKVCCINPAASGNVITTIDLCDGAGNPLIIKVEYISGAPVATYYNLNGTVFAGIPVACSSGVSGTIYVRERCDDVAGNGSNIVRFYQAYFRSYNGSVLTSTLIGNYTNDALTTTYVPVNQTDCSTLGSASKLKAARIVLSGSTFTTTSNMRSVKYQVQTVDSLITPPTFKGTDGIISNLYLNEITEIKLDNEIDILDNTIEITAGASDIVLITYTYF